MNEPERGSSFFKELARRRVYRAAAAYAVFAWVVIQAGSIAFPEFGAPAWAMRALIIVFIVGFPPAMLLAWTLDFSAKGLVRTPESRYSVARGIWPKIAIAAIATTLSAAVLYLAWDDYIVQERERLARPEIREQPVVAVQEPRRLVGSDENDWLGDGIATLIRSELAESRHVIVISRARWDALTGDASGEAEISARAREIGVDYLVHGEFFETPDGIVLTTHIEDVASGIELLSPRTTGRDASEIFAGIVQVATDIKRTLNIPHQERVGVFEADFAIENVEAYEAYVAGLSWFSDFDYRAAEEAFKTALEFAPDYHVARYRLAHVYDSTGRSVLARDTLEEIPADANLPERLRLYIEGAKAYFIADRDPRKAIEVYRRLVELYPYEMEAGLLLADAYWAHFQDQAAIAELRRLSEIHSYDPLSYLGLGERLLDVGELEEAGDALRKYAELAPTDPYAFALLGNLAMLQGDPQEAIRQHEHSLTLKPGFEVAMLGLARSRYLAGDSAAAEAGWRTILADEGAAADFRIDAAFDLAGVLRGAGRFAESLEPLLAAEDLIRDERLRLPMALSQMGTTQLELGNVEEASDLLDAALEEATSPATRYLFARGMMELRLGRFDALGKTIADIRLLSDSAEESGLTEQKAADYLAGMSALERGDVAAAAPLLQQALDTTGYQYAIYRLGMAMLYRAAGDLDKARQLALEAANERDPGDPRLDLELDRSRALLLQAEISAQAGARTEAADLARRFMERWADADAARPEVGRAQALLADGRD